MSRGKAYRDDRTLDLFAWQPPPAAVGFPHEAIRAATIAGRVSRAVANALRDCGTDRAIVARRMSDYLGEPVSVHVLNAYASQARDEHRINVPRYAALAHATGDMRLLGVVPELFGHAVIPNGLLPWIEIGQLAVHRDEINRAIRTSRRQVRGRGA